jgi:hypothetical protein
MQQVVVWAGEVEEPERLRKREHVLHERIDQRPRVRAEADRDQGLELATERSQVDFGAEAPNDPSCTQTSNPLETRRRGGAREG